MIKPYHDILISSLTYLDHPKVRNIRTNVQTTNQAVKSFLNMVTFFRIFKIVS